MKTSLVISVLNESRSINSFLGSLSTQSQSPNEIIIVDGGSSDDTVAKINQWSPKLRSLHLISKKGANISTSRNLGIRKASGDVIAITDVGLLDKDWLRNITRPFSDSSVDVVGGFFHPSAPTFFQKALAAVTIPTLPEIKPSQFLPSSRSVAFRKSAWQEVHGYPEWIPICEDIIFDLKLKKSNFKFAFAPDAISFWEPRPNIHKFFRQYYLYSRSDGHALLWPKRHAVRYLTYLFLLIALIALVLQVYWPIGLVLLGGLIYTYRLYHRFSTHFPDATLSHRLAAAFFIPILTFIGDLAKMVGFPVGLYERATGKVIYEKF